jgi:hypothetical protein
LKNPPHRDLEGCIVLLNGALGEYDKTTRNRSDSVGICYDGGLYGYGEEVSSAIRIKNMQEV